MLRLLLRGGLTNILILTWLAALTPSAAQAQNPDEADPLLRQVEQLYGEGKYAEALPLAQQSLAAMETKLGSQDPKVGEVLNMLGLLHWNLGQYAEAEPAYRRAIAIGESTPDRDSWVTGARLNNLAILLAGLARYDEATETYRHTLAIAEAAFGPDHSNVAKTLTNLAVVHWKQGRYGEAEALCKRALGIREKSLGPTHPDVAHSSHVLALVYTTQGRYSDAEPLEKRAIAIDEVATGPDHPNMISRLNTLADIYRLGGRYSEAEPLYKRALAVAEGAKTDQLIRGTLNNLAWLYRAQGRLGDAEPLLKRTVAIAERTLGGDHPDLTTHLHNLAEVLREKGAVTDAEALLVRAVKIGERTGGEDPNFAKALKNLGLVYQIEGRPAEAEAPLKRALAIAERTLGPGHPDVGDYLSELGALRALQGNLPDAASLLRRGTNIALARSRRTGDMLGVAQTGYDAGDAARSRQKLILLTKVLGRLALQSSEGQGDVAAEMLADAQQVQSSEAAASLSKMAARGAKDDPKLATLARDRQDLAGEWKAIDRLLLTALSLPPKQRNPASEQAQRDRMATIDRRIADIDQTLLQQFPDYFALTNPEPLSVQDAQASLRADEALILFLDTPAIKPAPEETFIWVVTKTDARRVRSDLGTAALSREVRALRCGLDEEEWAASTTATRCRELLAPADTQSPLRSLPFDVSKAYALYKALFGQVEDLIKGKHLLIVPSGPLTQLPFQVLVTAASGKADYRSAAWIARDHALSVLPAVSSLKALRRVARPSAATKPMIGFGDPLLDGPDSRYAKLAQLARDKQRCHGGSSQTVAAVMGARSVTPMEIGSGLAKVSHIRLQVPLPETADELCAVAGDLQADVKEMRLGARATEREVKALSESGQLADYRVVHFATHGAMAGQLRGTAEPGLLLTPPAEASAEDDGYLSASEIAGLKLDADWVILSACNTAAGEADGAQALSGLARAFFYAQARALLVSHWAVNSDATVKLITVAMREMSRDQSVGRAEALRRSMLTLIDKGKPQEAHPAYWAPFIVVGEGAR